MGANAVTTVPVYVAGEVLTAADLNITNSGIPVFATTTTRDAGFGGTGEKTLAQGQFCYLESTGKLQVYTGSAWSNVGASTNVERFTTSGTWTVPAGVTYARATIVGGGGGVGTSSSGAGGASSVAFAGGTVSAAGGYAINMVGTMIATSSMPALANSGVGANVQANTSAMNALADTSDGIRAYVGAAVTPGASITVTVGAGGTAGTNGSAGGSGFVNIEFEV